MFHRLTKICAHFKYSCDSILTQIHPVTILLTPRKSIPKSPEGFPDSFLTHWKTERYFYEKLTHLGSRNDHGPIYSDSRDTPAHSIPSRGTWEWFSVKALLFLYDLLQLFRSVENFCSQLLALAKGIESTPNRQEFFFPSLKIKSMSMFYKSVADVEHILAGKWINKL